MKTFYITTLGCKVNQYESDGIISELIENGFKKSDNLEDADICIINTCAVTSRAAMQSRQQIRSIIRSNSDAKIIVTGCHAQTEPEQIDKIENIHAILGHQDKFNIVEAVLKAEQSGKNARDKFNSQEPLPKTDQVANRRTPFFKPAVTGSKTRAYLKIQDGCNSFCTYCIVPYARGRSISMPKHEVFNHLLNLSSKGYKEAILTGIHVGAYGLDFEKNRLSEKNSSITELLIEIDKLKPIHRVRLSSIEPKELTDDIIHLAAKGDSTLCDHFHIPLQSGDDTILKLMERPYSVELFENLIIKIRNLLPNAAIGVDILVGFPGESDNAFENTFNLINKLPVTYLHVFPFSPRKGTPAYNYPNKVNNQIVKKRCALLRQLGAEKRGVFENMQIENSERHLEAIIQDKRDEKTDKLIAITSNYLSVLVDGNDNLKRQIVDISLNIRDKNNRLIGKVV